MCTGSGIAEPTFSQGDPPGCFNYTTGIVFIIQDTRMQQVLLGNNPFGWCKE